MRVENRTEKPLSLHWHGVRNRNAMDGVGGVTQAPIAPGADFTYDFVPPDAGTFLVRPLVVGGSSEPSGRGLSGFLVVAEKAPPAVEADVSLLMQDWRLQEDGSLLPFGQTAFAASNGRLGQPRDRSTAPTCRRPSRRGRAAASGCGSAMPATRGRPASASRA